MVSQFRLLFCAFAFSASLAVGGPIALIYGVTDSSQFGTLNLNTQTFSPIATLGFVPYSLVSTANGFLAISSTGLLESIGSSGATALIGNTGLTPDAMAGIGSTVYLLAKTRELYTVNTTNGVVSDVGSTGLGTIGAPLFDSSLQAVGGNLYYTFDTGSGNGTLYEINPLNASTSTIGSTIAGIDAAILLGGTDYVFQNNNLNPSDSTEYTLDLTTGNTTLVGSIAGGTGLYGVAVAPEPGSLLLTLFGLLGTACLAWKRKGRSSPLAAEIGR